jgi:hypothetical protein
VALNASRKEMPSPRYERTLLASPDNAVVVRIIATTGGVLAEVSWPANSETAAGDYFYPTHVPVALERADDVRENYGFRAVVILIENVSLWDNEWGILVEPKP